MEFLRRQLFLLLCGAGGAVGIALAVTGMGAMPAVVKDLEEVARIYNDLTTLQTKPVNQRVIDEHKKRIDEVLADRDAVFAEARKLYRFEPLVAGVFPNGNADQRREFRRAYQREMQALWESLRAGRPATEADIAAMKERIEEEDFRRSKLGETDDIDPGAEMTTPAGVLTRAGARRDPVARAHLAAAQRIYCYGVNVDDAKPPDLPASLLFDPAMRDTGTVEAPELGVCWRAQLRYWVMKEVVDAIVSLNEAAAAAARERDEVRWVGMMPVKDVISIRVSRGYVTPSDDDFAGAPAGGYGEALPPAAPKSAFTKSANNDTYEVLQFTVKLVMDQRDILRFVDRLSRNTFHTPLRVAYRALEPNRNMIGKIYGSEPAVNVVMDFETIMLGDIFRPMMPKEVCEEFNIRCEKGKGAGTSGESDDRRDED